MLFQACILYIHCMIFLVNKYYCNCKNSDQLLWFQAVKLRVSLAASAPTQPPEEQVNQPRNQGNLVLFSQASKKSQLLQKKNLLQLNKTVSLYCSLYINFLYICLYFKILRFLAIGNKVVSRGLGRFRKDGVFSLRFLM